MMPPFLCFESPWMAEAYGELFPSERERVIPFERLIFSLVEDLRLPRETRLQLFSSLLQPGELASSEPLITTIESLREGMILSHEEIDFCFSVLAATARHLRLKDLFHAYVDSELNHDWALHVWSVIERFRQQPVAPFDRSLCFIRASEPGYLFSEFCRVFPGKNQMSESWELGAGDSSSPRGTCYTGAGLEPLLAFRDAVQGALEKRKGPLWLAFEGAPQEKLFLELALKRAKVSFRFLNEEVALTKRSIFSRSRCLAYLRRHSPWPQRRLLEISRTLLETEWSPVPAHLWQLSDWQAMGERHLQSGRLTEEEAQFILRVPTELEPVDLHHTPKEAEPPPVWIVPFHPLFSTLPVLGYCGKSLLNIHRDPFGLTVREAELLFQKGFYVPRAADHRPRMRVLLDRFLEQPSAVLYTPLGKELSLNHSTTLCRHTKKLSNLKVPERTRIKVPLGKLSATQLEAYAQCPTKYFFANRLRLRPTPTLESTYALRFGQAAHAALENFFRNGGESVPQDQVPLKLQTLFEAELKREIPWLFEQSPFFIMFSHQFSKIAKKIPMLEERLIELKGQGRLRAVEQSFELKIGEVLVSGKMDRIEDLPDGSLLVLDYKTGTVSFSPDHLARGENFQALLYWMGCEALYHRPCAGVLFYDLKRGELKRGWLRGDRLEGSAKKMMTRGHVLEPTEFDATARAGLTRLRELAQEIAQGSFSPRPSASNCSVCDYVAYCRTASGYE